MKSKNTTNQSITTSVLVSIMLGLFLVMGIHAPAVQASDTDTNASSLKKFDALIQQYANTDLVEDPMADTYKPSEFNRMKKDLDLYLQKQDTSTKEKEIKAITEYVATRIYYNLKDKRYNPENGTEITSDNPYDVWYDKKGICSGYSNLLTTLMYARNIPSIHITAQHHAYNICYDEEQQKWLYVDATGCSGNRYTVDDQWLTADSSASAYLMKNYFNIDVTTFEKAPSSYFPYSISNLKRDGIYYSYRSCESNYNTSLNVKTWKDTENWFMSIVSPCDKNIQSLIVDTDNLAGIPITQIYAGFAGTNIESVDLSKTALQRLVTPTTKSAGSFEGCTKLKTVKLPDSVTYMDVKAFKDCTSLESINVPKSLRELTNSVFRNCTSLTKMDFTGTDLISMGSETFKECTSLKTVILGKHEKIYISGHDFYGCTALETVDCTGANIHSLDDYAFYNCSSLKKLDFSDSSFTTTGQSTFRGCSDLSEITLPATLQEIEYYALNGTAIETLNLANTSVKDIGYAGCYGMDKLQNIYLPSTLKTLGDFAFSCKNSSTITRVYSDLSTSEIRAIAKQSQNVWSGRTISYPQGSYTLSYDGNEADAGEMADETHLIELISFTLTANTYTREGYSFVGWNTAADGTGKTYKDKASVASLTNTDGETVTLYAMWKQDATQPDKPETPDTPDKPSNPEEEPDEYYITYKLDNGTNHKDNPECYTAGKEAELKDPTKEGHTFLGWFLDKDYTNQITKITTDLTGQITLYARWDACQWEETSKRAATCTSKGSITYTCTKCGATKRESLPIDPANHGATGIINKKTATATKEGYTGDTYCYRCKTIITTGTVIPKKDSSSSGTTSNPSGGTTTTPGTNRQPSTSTKPGSTNGKNSTVTTPDAVEDLKVVNKKGKALKITWTKQTGIKGYELQYAMDKKFKKSPKTIALKAKASSKTIKKLKKKKIYYVRIRCYTQTGTEKTYSAWSSVKKVKITK